MRSSDSVTQKQLLKWELVGIVFIFLAGSLLHFAFEWLACWRPVAAVAPVNESVWEHFKLSFYPGLLFAGIQFWVYARSVPRFWFAKFVGLLCMPVVIGLGFYAYTAGLGLTSSLIPNIVLLLVAVVVGQLASYRMLLSQQVQSGRAAGPMGIGIMVALFISFSYAPPRIFLFEDPSAHQYGILDLCSE